MQKTTTRDGIVGLFVLAGLAAIGYLSIALGGLSLGEQGGLHLLADFDEIGGLAVRAPVVISGVRVGEVEQIELSPDMRARVTLNVRRDLKLPVDTSAAIRTAGVLGDQFVALEPGAEDDLLKDGDILSFTENALNIEKLVGALVHGGNLGGSK